MDCQLLILTYPPDLHWVDYSLRSVQKFWKGDPPLIIATPECKGHLPPVAEEMGCQVCYEPAHQDNRRGQVYIKMNADHYLDSDLILITDSDCLFTKPFTVHSFMTEGRPIVCAERYDTLIPKSIPPDQNCFHHYQKIIGEVLHIIPDHEYMRRHPFLFYRDHIRDVRERIESKQNAPLWDVMCRYHSGYFSEFNFFGAFCHHYHPDLYDWREFGEWPDPIVRQFHSWSQSPTAGEAGEEVKRILS